MASIPLPTPANPLRIGTRASPLARAQADMAAAALVRAHGLDPAALEIVPMTATGDRIQDRALADVGGKALWTRELDAALDAGTIDIAVHSLKDVETLREARFFLGAMLERADPRDRLVVRDGIVATTIEALPTGARLGTSSPRRAAQVKRLRRDIETLLLRGNVQTRLARLAAGEVDATLLAAAGLDRLGMDDIGTVQEAAALLPRGIAGCDRDRMPQRRCCDPRPARGGRSSADAPRGRGRTRLSFGARRRLPLAGRGLCAFYGRWSAAARCRALFRGWGGACG